MGEHGDLRPEGVGVGGDHSDVGRQSAGFGSNHQSVESKIAGVGGEHGNTSKKAGKSDEAHAHDLVKTLRAGVTLVLVLVMAQQINHFLQNSSFGSALADLQRQLDEWELADQNEAAQKWREQLQTNMGEFQFSPQADAQIKSLLRLSKSPDRKISCTARLRLSTAYFATKQFDEVDIELEATESACAEEVELTEEIYHLHGRANMEMAKRRGRHLDIRRRYETVAWDKFDKAWEYGRQQKDFAAMTVLQMCNLSGLRGDVTISQVETVLSRLDEILDEERTTQRAEKSGLLNRLSLQQRPMTKLRESLEEKDTDLSRLIEEKKAAKLQQQVYPTSARQPRKSLKDVFETK